MAGLEGFEPTTDRLTADCSAAELEAQMEQVRRIELPRLPWQGNVLPLNYTCMLEFWVRFELTIVVLQTTALPLGYQNYIL